MSANCPTCGVCTVCKGTGEIRQCEEPGCPGWHVCPECRQGYHWNHPPWTDDGEAESEEQP